MKDTPWQDIYSLKEWTDILNEYCSRKRDGSAKGPLDPLGSLLRVNRTVPPELAHITQQIQVYSGTPKASIEKLRPRIQMLVTIGLRGQKYLTNHSIPLKPQMKKEDRNLSMDYAVAKLVRRAERKAEYLRKLCEHLESGDRGFLPGRKTLLDYLASKEARHSPGLLGVNSADMMEKIDPWHRGFDLKRTSDKNIPYIAGGASVLGFAFYQWQRSESEVPFFVWLEGHGICTGQMDDTAKGWLDNAQSEKVGQVIYREGDKQLSPEILMIGAHNGSLWAYKTDKEGNVDLDLYDTSATTNGFRNSGMDAYVWSRDGLIFAAPHMPGQLHHSSFTSGGKVKCAGFIGVVQGKVVSVSNDSGHYKPPPAYLRDFVSYLQEQTVVEQNATFELSGIKKGMSWQELLTWKPQLPGPKPLTPLKPPVPANRPGK